MLCQVELDAEQTDYLRQRLEPKPGDPLYLHLADLRLALATVASELPLTILDFGAGLSPYRALFPNSDYRRADLDGEEALDYRIGDDGRTPAPSGAFDLVLSTQVAEHVADPPAYFEECRRLLKPGGTVVLSTHGTFEDHQHPHDFQRWTADGLKRDLAASGFTEIAVHKMTTGPRAVMFLDERCLDSTFVSRKTASGMVLWLRRSLHRRSRRLKHRYADFCFDRYRFVRDDEPGHNLYVGLIAVGKNPHD